LRIRVLSLPWQLDGLRSLMVAVQFMVLQVRQHIAYSRLNIPAVDSFEMPNHEFFVLVCFIHVLLLSRPTFFPKKH
jgi:hypothetical protein